MATPKASTLDEIVCWAGGALGGAAAAGIADCAAMAAEWNIIARAGVDIFLGLSAGGLGYLFLYSFNMGGLEYFEKEKKYAHLPRSHSSAISFVHSNKIKMGSEKAYESEEARNRLKCVYRGPFHPSEHFEARYRAGLDAGIPKEELDAECLREGNELRLRLMCIHNSTPEHPDWFSARYEAGKALGVPKEELDSKLKQWFGKEEEMIPYWNCQCQSGGDPPTITVTSQFSATDSKTIEVPDYSGCSAPIGFELLMKMSQIDVLYFYNNLPEKEQRKTAGKALGYSSLRIWLHEVLRKCLVQNGKDEK